MRWYGLGYLEYKEWGKLLEDADAVDAYRCINGNKMSYSWVAITSGGKIRALRPNHFVVQNQLSSKSVIFLRTRQNEKKNGDTDQWNIFWRTTISQSYWIPGMSPQWLLYMRMNERKTRDSLEIPLCWIKSSESKVFHPLNSSHLAARANIKQKWLGDGEWRQVGYWKRILTTTSW